MFQAFVIFLFLLLFSLLVATLFRKFNKDLRISLLFIIPLAVFSLGFAFRLTAKPVVVDLGFFLTDFSELFVSILFAVCLILGQIRYWKIK